MYTLTTCQSLVVILVLILVFDVRSIKGSDEDKEDPFPVNCGPFDNADRITHGELCRIDDYPWMALLKFRVGTESGYGCAGSLISKRYVLTAAHCVLGKFGKPFEVALGEYNLLTKVDCEKLRPDTTDQVCNLPPQIIAVEKVTSHPEYVINTQQRLHDIALIKLKTPVEYTDFVKPICVPSPEIQKIIIDEKISKKGTLTVSGWGRTKHSLGSTVKRQAQVPVIDIDKCSMNRPFKITATQLCAGGGLQDTCSGDSGGPMMSVHSLTGNDVQWFVNGITSFGTKECGVEGIPSVYTNVSAYYDWIVETMKA